MTGGNPNNSGKGKFNIDVATIDNDVNDTLHNFGNDNTSRNFDNIREDGDNKNIQDKDVLFKKEPRIKIRALTSYDDDTLYDIEDWNDSTDSDNDHKCEMKDPQKSLYYFLSFFSFWALGLWGCDGFG